MADRISTDMNNNDIGLFQSFSNVSDSDPVTTDIDFGVNATIVQCQGAGQLVWVNWQGELQVSYFQDGEPKPICARGTRTSGFVHGINRSTSGIIKVWWGITPPNVGECTHKD